jgi:hypothetical protein
MREMKRLMVAGLAAASLCASGAASADWSLNGGFESFRWKESTTPAVKESGLRLTLGLSWRQSREPGISAGYDLKAYRGDVDYTGATLFTGTPISGETRYRGWSHEVQAIWRAAGSAFDVVLAGGVDSWERRLTTAQQEDWLTIYVKLGMAYNQLARQGVMGSLGVKYPTWTRENGHLESVGALNNPKIRPGKEPSLYGTLGYRFNPKWDVTAYYDSFRFKESNQVSVVLPGGFANFFQPESRMDVFGVKIQHNF